MEQINVEKNVGRIRELCVIAPEVYGDERG